MWHNSVRMPLYLGIDGGGTKTSFALADDTHILARVTEGGSSPTRIDEATVQRTLRAGVETACAKAGVRPRDIEFACLGSAGVAIQAGRQLLEETMREVIEGQFAVVGDMLIAHEAAFFGSSGVIVISGTGSIAFGVNDVGENARAGGRGPIVSDEGSGTWIGRKAVSTLLRAWDSGQETCLDKFLLPAWQINNADDLVRKCARAGPNEFSRLFPAVQSAAASGDFLAQDLLTQAGMELATIARIVARRLWPRTNHVRVAMAGGIFRNSPTIRIAFYNHFHAEHQGSQVRLTALPPVLGAIAMARRMARADLNLRIRYDDDES
jgi:N-acetylglucosamine kinase-like BadF-type ATPase